MTNTQVLELIKYMDERFNAVELAIDKLSDEGSFEKLKSSVDRVCRKLGEVELATKRLLDEVRSHH